MLDVLCSTNNCLFDFKFKQKLKIKTDGNIKKSIYSVILIKINIL